MEAQAQLLIGDDSQENDRMAQLRTRLRGQHAQGLEENGNAGTVIGPSWRRESAVQVGVEQKSMLLYETQGITFSLAI